MYRAVFMVLQNVSSLMFINEGYWGKTAGANPAMDWHPVQESNNAHTLQLLQKQVKP